MREISLSSLNQEQVGGRLTSATPAPTAQPVVATGPSSTGRFFTSAQGWVASTAAGFLGQSPQAREQAAPRTPTALMEEGAAAASEDRVVSSLSGATTESAGTRRHSRPEVSSVPSEASALTGYTGVTGVTQERSVVRRGESNNLCVKGCGRPRYRQYKTCCTRCQGLDGPHADDCCAKPQHHEGSHKKPRGERNDRGRERGRDRVDNRESASATPHIDPLVACWTYVPTWRLPLAIAGTVFLLVVHILAFIVLTPTVVLLALPCSRARLAFEWWASHVKAWFLGCVVMIAQVAWVCQWKLHMDLEAIQNVSPERPMLLVSNHRTALDWGWLLGLLNLIGRLGGLRMVAFDLMRHVPLIGWIIQFFGFILINRNLQAKAGEGEKTMNYLRRVAAASRQQAEPLAVMLFPEGRTLNAASIEASNQFADSKKLPRYTQVLHPKTRGFTEVWKSLSEGPEPPVVLDCTVAFANRMPAENAGPLQVLFLGRSPYQVHIAAEVLDGPPKGQSPDEWCKELFKRKEERLKSWYDGEESFLWEGEPAKLFPRGANTDHVPVLGHRTFQHLITSAIVFVIFAAAFYMSQWPQVLGRRLPWVIMGVEAVFCVLFSVMGGVDSLLLWHAERWPTATPQEPGNFQSELLT